MIISRFRAPRGLRRDLISWVCTIDSCHRSIQIHPFKRQEVLSLQPMIPPKPFDIFSPLTGGCSEALDALLVSSDFSLNTTPR